MSIGPLLPGRIPSSLIARRINTNLSRATSLLTNLQDQVATGQKFFLPSDAPAAAIRSIYLQSTLERREQLEANIKLDKSMLSASENALTPVSDVLNQAKSFVIAGVGDNNGPAEKQAMATEVVSMIKSVVAAANNEFRGRYLFGGSMNTTPPFEILNDGSVRYNGDAIDINSFVDTDLTLSNNIDGATAFGAITEPVGANINPALSLDTKLADLHGGLGVTLGAIQISVDDTVNPVQTVTVDLSNAETVGDLKTLIENAVGAGPPSVTVAVDPASFNGLRITPSGGTVAVSDLGGGHVASDLGIASAAAAVINGSDLDPRLTMQTKLSDLNNGTGIGATAGNGLYIVNGSKSGVVDISSATTVEDLVNVLKNSNFDLMVGINEAGNGLAVSGRVSGVNFSIGENNGSNATALGLRTFTGATLLKDLNLGRGVPVNEVDGGGTPVPALLEITRRDGTTTNVDLQGLDTVQQVLNAINAVDPGVLTASLNAVGNGISIVDTSGTGALTIAASNTAVALGVDGTEPGPTNTTALVGKEVNPRQATGVLNLLVRLQGALQSGDDRELERLDPLFDGEIERFNQIRGELGSRLKTLEQVESRLADREVALQESLSDEIDADMAETITQLARVTATYQAILQLTAQSFQLSLMNYL